MTMTLGDRLQQADLRLYGRDDLVASLAALPQGEHPLVVHLDGVAGIGKSSVMEAVAREAAEAGTCVAFLDGATVEPTDVAFVSALVRAAGISVPPDTPIRDALASLPRPTLLLLDSFEALRLLDSWFRDTLVPSLPGHARVVVASRHRPAPAWTRAVRTPDLFKSITLGPLDATDAHAFLATLGIAPDVASRINGVAGGHPLALTLAAQLIRDEPDSSVEDAATEGIIGALSSAYVEELRDPLTRRALEAAAVTRRTTKPILAVQLPDDDVDRAYARIDGLPFVRRHADGLSLNESVGLSLSTRLAAVDPVRHRELRRAAWRELVRALSDAGDSDLWRYTSDILYLLQNPLIREGYFPAGPPTLSIEPALPGDHEAIRAISRQHEGPQAAAITEAWLAQLPEAFSVVRDASGTVVAFRCATASSEIPASLVDADPLLPLWLTELEEREHDGLDGYLVRRWLTRDDGEGPSEAQGLCWLDCKRWYFRLRGQLGSVLIALRDLEQYEGALATLGFRRIPAAAIELDHERYVSIVQDFGPGGVDGWYARLVGTELGLDPSDLLDASNQEIVVGGDRIHLTPLEFEVMQQLARAAGQSVSHAELVEHVWGYRYTGESNVDAVVVRGIRSKLGDRASMIETVRGVGYRLRLD